MPATLSSLERAAVGRPTSIFAEDLAAWRAALERGLHDQAILVVGGAGSIGAATTRLLAEYGPARLHLVDQDENGLVEVVRDLRSSGLGDRVGELRALALDYGSPVMRRFLVDGAPYQVVLNFAAIKHVRSEKDVPSILHMLDTNIVKPQRLLTWLADSGFSGSYYAVSTDKAADPVNFMGASKYVQEILTLESDALRRLGARATCARFANVAFSNGSLLYGCLRRLEREQPLSVPRRVRRFLITHVEAAQICVLTAVCAPSGLAVVPRAGSLEPLELTRVVEAILAEHGRTPTYCNSEAEARAGSAGRQQRGYPVLLTEPDTAGEKLAEQFLGEDEQEVDIGMRALVGARRAASGGPGAAQALARAVESLIASPERATSAEGLAALLGSSVPRFRHAASARNLDERM